MDGTGSTLQDCYLMPGREYSPFLQSLLGSTSDCDVLHRGATCCTAVPRVAPLCHVLHCSATCYTAVSRVALLCHVLHRTFREVRACALILHSLAHSNTNAHTRKCVHVCLCPCACKCVFVCVRAQATTKYPTTESP